MRVLRLVGASPRPRDLTLGDLDRLADIAAVLPLIDEARGELADAIGRRDLELAMRASRRFVGIGGLLGVHARTLDLLLRKDAPTS